MENETLTSYMGMANQAKLAELWCVLW